MLIICGFTLLVVLGFFFWSGIFISCFTVGFFFIVFRLLVVLEVWFLLVIFLGVFFVRGLLGLVDIFLLD